MSSDTSETVMAPDQGRLNDLFHLVNLFGASVVGLQYPLTKEHKRTEAYFRVNGEVWINGSLDENYIKTAIEEALEAVGSSFDDYRSFKSSSIGVDCDGGGPGLLTVNKLQEWPIVHIELSKSFYVAPRRESR